MANLEDDLEVIDLNDYEETSSSCVSNTDYLHTYTHSRIVSTSDGWTDAYAEASSDEKVSRKSKKKRRKAKSKIGCTVATDFPQKDELPDEDKKKSHDDITEKRKARRSRRSGKDALQIQPVDCDTDKAPQRKPRKWYRGGRYKFIDNMIVRMEPFLRQDGKTGYVPDKNWDKKRGRSLAMKLHFLNNRKKKEKVANEKKESIEAAEKLENNEKEQEKSKEEVEKKENGKNPKPVATKDKRGHESDRGRDRGSLAHFIAVKQRNNRKYNRTARPLPKLPSDVEISEPEVEEVPKKKEVKIRKKKSKKHFEDYHVLHSYEWRSSDEENAKERPPRKKVIRRKRGEKRKKKVKKNKVTPVLEYYFSDDDPPPHRDDRDLGWLNENEDEIIWVQNDISLTRHLRRYKELYIKRNGILRHLDHHMDKYRGILDGLSKTLVDYNKEKETNDVIKNVVEDLVTDVERLVWCQEFLKGVPPKFQLVYEDDELEVYRRDYENYPLAPGEKPLTEEELAIFPVTKKISKKKLTSDKVFLPIPEKKIKKMWVVVFDWNVGFKNWKRFVRIEWRNAKTNEPCPPPKMTLKFWKWIPRRKKKKKKDSDSDSDSSSESESESESEEEDSSASDASSIPVKKKKRKKPKPQIVIDCSAGLKHCIRFVKAPKKDLDTDDDDLSAGNSDEDTMAESEEESTSDNSKGSDIKDKRKLSKSEKKELKKKQKAEKKALKLKKKKKKAKKKEKRKAKKDRKKEKKKERKAAKKLKKKEKKKKQKIKKKKEKEKEKLEKEKEKEKKRIEKEKEKEERKAEKEKEKEEKQREKEEKKRLKEIEIEESKKEKEKKRLEKEEERERKRIEKMNKKYEKKMKNKFGSESDGEEHVEGGKKKKQGKFSKLLEKLKGKKNKSKKIEKTAQTDDDSDSGKESFDIPRKSKRKSKKRKGSKRKSKLSDTSQSSISTDESRSTVVTIVSSKENSENGKKSPKDSYETKKSNKRSIFKWKGFGKKKKQPKRKTESDTDVSSDATSSSNESLAKKKRTKRKQKKKSSATSQIENSFRKGSNVRKKRKRKVSWGESKSQTDVSSSEFHSDTNNSKLDKIDRKGNKQKKKRSWKITLPWKKNKSQNRDNKRNVKEEEDSSQSTDALSLNKSSSTIIASAEKVDKVKSKKRKLSFPWKKNKSQKKSKDKDSRKKDQTSLPSDDVVSFKETSSTIIESTEKVDKVKSKKRKLSFPWKRNKSQKKSKGKDNKKKDQTSLPSDDVVSFKETSSTIISSAEKVDKVKSKKRKLSFPWKKNKSQKKSKDKDSKKKDQTYLPSDDVASFKETSSTIIESTEKVDKVKSKKRKLSFPWKRHKSQKKSKDKDSKKKDQTYLPSDDVVSFKETSSTIISSAEKVDKVKSKKRKLSFPWKRNKSQKKNKDKDSKKKDQTSLQSDDVVSFKETSSTIISSAEKVDKVKSKKRKLSFPWKRNKSQKKSKDKDSKKNDQTLLPSDDVVSFKETSCTIISSAEKVDKVKSKKRKLSFPWKRKSQKKSKLSFPWKRKSQKKSKDKDSKKKDQTSLPSDDVVSFKETSSTIISSAEKVDKVKSKKRKLSFPWKRNKSQKKSKDKDSKKNDQTLLPSDDVVSFKETSSTIISSAEKVDKVKSKKRKLSFPWKRNKSQKKSKDKDSKKKDQTSLPSDDVVSFKETSSTIIASPEKVDKVKSKKRKLSFPWKKNKSQKKSKDKDNKTKDHTLLPSDDVISLKETSSTIISSAEKVDKVKSKKRKLSFPWKRKSQKKSKDKDNKTKDHTLLPSDDVISFKETSSTIISSAEKVDKVKSKKRKLSFPWKRKSQKKSKDKDSKKKDQTSLPSDDVVSFKETSSTIIESREKVDKVKSKKRKLSFPWKRNKSQKKSKDKDSKKKDQTLLPSDDVVSFKETSSTIISSTEKVDKVKSKKRKLSFPWKRNKSQKKSKDKDNKKKDQTLLQSDDVVSFKETSSTIIASTEKVDKVKSKKRKLSFPWKRNKSQKKSKDKDSKKKDQTSLPSDDVVSFKETSSNIIASPEKVDKVKSKKRKLSLPWKKSKSGKSVLYEDIKGNEEDSTSKQKGVKKKRKISLPWKKSKSQKNVEGDGKKKKDHGKSLVDKEISSSKATETISIGPSVSRDLAGRDQKSRKSLRYSPSKGLVYESISNINEQAKHSLEKKQKRSFKLFSKLSKLFRKEKRPSEENNSQNNNAKDEHPRKSWRRFLWPWGKSASADHAVTTKSSQDINKRTDVIVSDDITLDFVDEKREEEMKLYLETNSNKPKKRRKISITFKNPFKRRKSGSSKKEDVNKSDTVHNTSSTFFFPSFDSEDINGHITSFSKLEGASDCRQAESTGSITSTDDPRKTISSFTNLMAAKKNKKVSVASNYSRLSSRAHYYSISDTGSSDMSAYDASEESQEESPEESQEEWVIDNIKM